MDAQVEQVFENRHNDVLDIPSICITSLWRRPFNVLFRIGEQRTRFYCHKEVLRTHSTKFAKELTDTQETVIIEVPDICKEAFQTVVRYIYNKDLAVKYSYVVEAMVAANRFKFDSLKKALFEFAKRRTDYTTAITLFKQFESVSDADKANIFPLKNLALETIDKYGVNALTQNQFNSLSVDSLCQLFTRDTLRVNELMLISMAIIWAKNKCIQLDMNENAENIRLLLGDAFYQLRFALLTVDELVSICMSNLLITREECDSILGAIVESSPETLLFPSQRRAELGFCMNRFKKEELKKFKKKTRMVHQIDLKVTERVRFVAIAVYLPQVFHDTEGAYLVVAEVYNSNAMQRLSIVSKRHAFGCSNTNQVAHFIFTNVFFLESHVRYSIVLTISVLGEPARKVSFLVGNGKKGSKEVTTFEMQRKITWKFKQPKMRFGIHSDAANKSSTSTGQFNQIFYDFD